MENHGKSFVLYNANEQKILAEENSTAEVPVASLTKLMVATVILEDSDLKLGDEVDITWEMLYDLAEWSVVGLRAGDRATVEDLLYALLLPSAGDAGQALAIADAGSIAAFADKMNQKAAALGMKNSHFSNPIGRDEDNHSTAQDIAKLLFHALENPTFKSIFSATTYDFSPLGITIKKTTDSYGLDTAIISGSKTGFTNAAGRCLASTATVDGVDYLFVTLGHEETPTHITDTISAYTYYGENYGYREVISKAQVLGEIPVVDSEVKTYALVAPETFKYYMEKSYDLADLEIDLSHIDEITRHTELGSEIAHLAIRKDTETIYETSFMLEEKIDFHDHAPLIATAIIAAVLFPIVILLILRLNR